VQARPRILAYLQQDAATPSTLDDAKKQLAELVNWIDQMEKVLRAQAANKAASRPAQK
jgi:hypothetical protein